jgi:hypothetical protein
MLRLENKGVSAFLQKPFTAQQLGQKLLSVLGK